MPGPVHVSISPLTHKAKDFNCLLAMALMNEQIIRRIASNTIVFPSITLSITYSLDYDCISAATLQLG